MGPLDGVDANEHPFISLFARYIYVTNAYDSVLEN